MRDQQGRHARGFRRQLQPARGGEVRRHPLGQRHGQRAAAQRLLQRPEQRRRRLGLRQDQPVWGNPVARQSRPIEQTRLLPVAAQPQPEQPSFRSRTARGQTGGEALQLMHAAALSPRSSARRRRRRADRSAAAAGEGVKWEGEQLSERTCLLL